jgi:Mini-chromosome maintenance replisome factor
MEAVQNWTKEYFLNNQDVCLEKLKSLTGEERAALRENIELGESNKIVLTFGMVIDTQEPEFYCEKYEVKSSDGSTRIENGKFCDKLNINEDETVEDPSKHLSERQTVIIARPTSTNQWVYEITAAKNSNKRKLEDDQESDRAFTVKVKT